MKRIQDWGVLKWIDANPFWTIGIMMLFYSLFLFQGFDVCDSGWYACYYRDFFDAPYCTEYNFMYYLAGLIGGVWLKLFPWAGMLGLRVLGTLIQFGSILLVYLLLKKYVQPSTLMVGIVILLCSGMDAPFEFFHNQLTTLLFLSVVYCLVSGLRKSNLILFAMAGVLLVLDVLTRIPNVLHVAIVGIILVDGLYQHTEFKKMAYQVLSMFAGFVVGVIGVYGLMRALGHIEPFSNALSTVFAMGQSSEGHGIQSLIRTNLAVYRKVFGMGCALYGLYKLSEYFTIRYGEWGWIKRIVKVCLSLILVLYCYKKFNISLIYALSFFALLFVLTKKEFGEIKTIGWCGSFMMLVLPLGSDGSIGNMGYYSIWLSWGMAFGYYWNNIKNEDSSLYKLTVCSVLMGLCVGALHKIAFDSTYFDPTSRIHKTYAINSPKAKYLYTTEERATIINEMIADVENCAKPSDYLMTYGSIPMIYYLTDTKPYLYNSWPGLWMDQQTEALYRRAASECNGMPVVLMLKFETIGRFSKPSEDYPYQVHMFDSEKEIEMMKDFLSKNNYIKVLDKDYYNIYVSEVINK